MDETNTEINKKLNQTNSIEEFYATAVILLTGATGFVGKALLEKLMRVCPRTAAIFILLRPKRNQTIEQRFKKLIDDPVQGDVNLPDLGLSLEDRIVLIEKVNIVFHVAATVSFKQPLAVAVNINTKAQLIVVHLPEIEEKVYTTSWEPSTIIDIFNKQVKSSIALLEETIFKTHPNTYTFTKNLVELIVFNECKSFPTAIVRPSIIASLEEPVLIGWTIFMELQSNDFLSQFNVIGIQISKDNAKVLLVKKDARLDLVPTVSPTRYCVPRGMLPYIEVVKLKYITVRVTQILLGYPYSKLVGSILVYNILNIFVHVLPALVIDIVLKLRDKEQVMMKINKRFNQLLTLLTYFHLREWTFHRDNVYKMADDIKVLKDSNKMKLDLRNMDWKEYITNYQARIVKFILKEKYDPIKAARRLSLFY
ncbi:hypothetical protein K0M31_001872 [Melipona bicolor]|uniref:Fatty acyl-CoA reductase n=1 Tax=Melipona bicolor TaxID=60889 RepID=A0AA40KY44_9HYME|nr:hypothetical protein K0M31_001872 [Melipona bicolor]